jgi:hypothetical protein
VFQRGNGQDAGKRRAQLRRRFGQAGIVLRQVGKPVRRIAIVGVVEFRAGGPLLRLQRQKHRAPDPEAVATPMPSKTLHTHDARIFEIT